MDEKNKVKDNSLIEKYLRNKSNFKEKDFEKHKFESLKLSIVIGLFIWLIISVILKNIIFGGGISIIFSLLLFVMLIQSPILKRKKRAKVIENELPLFLTRLACEVKLGKTLPNAINSTIKSDEKSEISKEFELVLKDMNKGISFSIALNEMNKRVCSENLKRALSNLSNISSTGKKDVLGLKKLTSELLLKQRIESKEFSGKMVVYALVFIAVSAIVPAMFLSFVLIGSYFMKLSFTPQQIFLISVVLFPLIDGGVLIAINSKTPLFLRG
ncbi:MAG: type II secretion system F family protein [Candidatus ainarchaeum sp.]|jgi:flagellar protein FlaJ|nr:type II secretion system F family protein [Candidatus ainarchaeum sp.]MDD3085804.1 type II secretion system F family protein [Candidatus ainarchaeum sp.]MDD4128456.1 type II secretion system F family protein [Candidatus ainarchaeum sp.]MDD4467950.1 type II secretion system F family protein [Candidatus ainarchaeum sp.]